MLGKLSLSRKVLLRAREVEHRAVDGHALHASRFSEREELRRFAMRPLGEAEGGALRRRLGPGGTPRSYRMFVTGATNDLSFEEVYRRAVAEVP